MKYAPAIAGGLLGLLFIMSASVVLFGMAPMPEIPKDTPQWHFMEAFVPTGYLTLVKVLELVGGILVAIPRTRNLGLLVLGPIIVNILAFHAFVTADGFLNPIIIGICLIALYLLWVERRAFGGLVKR